MRFVMEKHVNSLRADSFGLRQYKGLQWFLFELDKGPATYAGIEKQYVMLHTGKMGFRLA